MPSPAGAAKGPARHGLEPELTQLFTNSSEAPTRRTKQAPNALLENNIGRISSTTNWTKVPHSRSLRRVLD